MNAINQDELILALIGVVRKHAFEDDNPKTNPLEVEAYIELREDEEMNIAMSLLRDMGYFVWNPYKEHYVVDRKKIKNLENKVYDCACTNA